MYRQVCCSIGSEFVVECGHFSNKQVFSPTLFYYFTILKRLNWKNKFISLKSFVIIPDILTADSKYCFTDGIGKISVGKAREICTKYFGGFGGQASIKYASTFQIRFAGFKGVLSAWPDLVTDQIQFRPSMNKFSR